MTTLPRKLAIVINGDLKARHVSNVSASLAILKKDGFETFVASAAAPQKNADHYAQPTVGNIKKLLVEMNARDDDEVVIYITGHGNKQGGSGGICLGKAGKDCDHADLLDILQGQKYRTRTVIEDQCFGGNHAARFLESPRTLFVSFSSYNEIDHCQETVPYFWSTKVPDKNHDGAISWLERFDYATKGRDIRSFPKFGMSQGYQLAGKKPPFPDTLLTGAQTEEWVGRSVYENFIASGTQIDCRGRNGFMCPLQTSAWMYLIGQFTVYGSGEGVKSTMAKWARESLGQHLFLWLGPTDSGDQLKLVHNTPWGQVYLDLDTSQDISNAVKDFVTQEKYYWLLLEDQLRNNGSSNARIKIIDVILDRLERDDLRMEDVLEAQRILGKYKDAKWKSVSNKANEVLGRLERHKDYLLRKQQEAPNACE